MIKGDWKAIAVCIVASLAAIPPRGVYATPTPLLLNISFSIGSIAAQFDITKPVAQPGTGVFLRARFISTLATTLRRRSSTPTSSRPRLQMLIH